MMLARGRGRVFSPGKLSRLSLKPPDWRVKVRMLAVREKKKHVKESIEQRSIVIVSEKSTNPTQRKFS